MAPPTKKQKLDIQSKWNLKGPKPKQSATVEEPKETGTASAPAGGPSGSKDVPRQEQATSSTTTSTSSTCIPDDEPPRRYGYWCSPPGPKANRPWALILFAGASRPGDIQHALCAKGWRVCAVDTISPRPTDILCEATWDSIRNDLITGRYQALWIATPCETFSPLREKPPGPRVLRTVEHIEGLPRNTLTQAEQKQLKESNILVRRTSSAAEAQDKTGGPWGVENPDHKDGKPSLWQMPTMVKLIDEKADGDVRFDQCMTGLQTTKPTRLVTKRMELTELHNLRCNHPIQEVTKDDGSKYRAAHPSTVQRWVTKPDGTRERASKSQGQYTAQLSEIIARAFHATQAGAQWLQDELDRELLP
eukprot:s3840_g3.t1